MNIDRNKLKSQIDKFEHRIKHKNFRFTSCLCNDCDLLLSLKNLSNAEPYDRKFNVHDFLKYNDMELSLVSFNLLQDAIEYTNSITYIFYAAHPVQDKFIDLLSEMTDFPWELCCFSHNGGNKYQGELCTVFKRSPDEIMKMAYKGAYAIYTLEYLIEKENSGQLEELAESVYNLHTNILNYMKG